MMKRPTRAQRKEMRAQIAKAHKAHLVRLRARVKELRLVPAVARSIKKQQRRRQKQLAAVGVAALLLLLLRLDCSGDPVEAAVANSPIQKQIEPPKRDASSRPPSKNRPRLKGKVDPSPRSSMAVDKTHTPPWLAQFRMQVAARSTRLATCFVGSEKPGALRWSALVHARSGRVTESTIEPAFRGVSLDSTQEACLNKGLIGPTYKLDEPDPQAAARRVSLIFEF